MSRPKNSKNKPKTFLVNVRKITELFSMDAMIAIDIKYLNIIEGEKNVEAVKAEPAASEVREKVSIKRVDFGRK